MCVALAKERCERTAAAACHAGWSARLLPEEMLRESRKDTSRPVGWIPRIAVRSRRFT